MKKLTIVTLTILTMLSLTACNSIYTPVEPPLTVAPTEEASADVTVDETVSADKSSKDGTSAETVPAHAVVKEEPIDLSTKDIYNNSFDYTDIPEAKLILMNYWEPWCGPCVRELPDLDKLYKNYKDSGLVVIGVYSAFDMDEDALDLVKEMEISFPVIRTTEALEAYRQNYVPATYLFTGDGKLYTAEPYIGSQSYEEWEKIVKEYLP